MPVTTGLSGNEIFCLEKKGYAPGNILVGNRAHALDFIAARAQVLKRCSVVTSNKGHNSSKEDVKESTNGCYKKQQYLVR